MIEHSENAKGSSGKLGKVVVSRCEISRRTSELGKQISLDYQERDLLVIGVLKGAAFFTADLVRSIGLPVSVDWIRVSTYGMGDISDGTVRMLSDVSLNPAGRDVLLVEDILDSGLTLHHLIRHFKEREANSVEVCTLLRKPGSVRYPVDPRYVGFDINVHWVAGNGIDYSESYRGNPDIREVKTS